MDQILPQDAVPGENLHIWTDGNYQAFLLHRTNALSIRGVAHEVAIINERSTSKIYLNETNEAAADALSVGIGTDKAPTMRSYLG